IRGVATNVDLADVVGLAPEVRIGLDVNAEETPEAVEVVDVGTAEHGRQSLEHVVDRHADEARFLAVEIHFDLRIAGIEGGEDVADLGTLVGRFHELTAEIAELRYTERAAAILEQKVETRGRAEAGDRRDVEREDDRLRNLGELFCQPRHDG